VQGPRGALGLVASGQTGHVDVPGVGEHPSPQRCVTATGSQALYCRHGVQAMTKRRTLILIVYAPALVGDDGRTLAVVHGIERALPGVRLEWELSKAGRPIALPQRDRWLAEASARGKFPPAVQRRRELPRDGYRMGNTCAPKRGRPATI